ncbi:hypothetical protein D3C74_255000 [compost metagenome]
MSSFIDPVFQPLVIDDELLLAIYELELATAPRQDQPPRAYLRTVLDGVPRPSKRCLETENNTRAREGPVHGIGPVRVYSRSPPVDREPDGRT